jgi:hypothetical protein
MKQKATVLLVAGNPLLQRDAALTLDAAEYHVVTEDSSDAVAPDIILRHFETRMQPPPGPAPVLTLDLSLVAGADLVDVVERGLGRRIARRREPAGIDYFVALLRGEPPSGNIYSLRRRLD